MSVLSPEAYMQHALQLARRGLGNTAENPAVGCLIVNEGRIVGRGYTRAGGRPHAETEALVQAGALAKNAEVFVTLEPCSHFGKTPPCAQALIDSGVAKVSIALGDPNPEVHGKGIAMLKAAGIEVAQDVCLSEALFLNQGYIMRRTLKRPMMVAKLATSLDSAMALANGNSRWITGKHAREIAQGYRASFDALLSGIGTVLADNPRFTVRLPGLEQRLPLRAIVDSHLRLPPEAALVQQAKQHPLRIYCLAGAEQSSQAEALTKMGVTVKGIAAAEQFGGLRLWDVLHDLAELGVNRLMLEAGPILMSSFLRERLIDRMIWFRSNCLLGEDALSAIGGFGLEELSHAPRLIPVHRDVLGADTIEVSMVEYS